MRPGRKSKEDLFMAETQKADIKALMDTPEVKAALLDAAKAGAAAAVAEMAKTKGDGLGEDAATELLSRLALAIGEIGDQGTSRKRVAPEILARRTEAARKCEDLAAKCRHEFSEARRLRDDERADNWTPQYRVVAKTCLGDNPRIVEPYRAGRTKGSPPIPQEIIFFGIPNDAMRPINDIAKQLYDLFKESIGSTERLKSVKYRDANGNVGIATQDTRPMWVTPGSLVVKGDAPPKAFVAPPLEESQIAFRDNNDPNATEVRVLGTIAAPAKKNFADATAVRAR
jgi:hypothetical protein